MSHGHLFGGQLMAWMRHPRFGTAARTCRNREPRRKRRPRTVDEARQFLEDVGYSPVNRNSACHGPATWTTSQ